VYTPLSDGGGGGFQYRLAEYLAEMLGMKIDVHIVTMDDYFSASESDKPDLLRSVDLYADILTILPERERMLRFVRTIPVKQMLITRKGDELRSISALQGKFISIQPQSSYAVRLRSIETDLDATFKYIEVTETADMVKSVVESRADVTAQDSILCLSLLKRYENLAVAMPISDMQFLGWALDRENLLLASLVRKYIDYTQESGFWERLWREEYGITYLDYIDLIGT
jgi:ABC-type amino acid transport substrate-binding protein